MGYETMHGFCRTCGRASVFQREAVNHILHLLITLFLCGLWAPVWLVLVILRPSYRCTNCGR